MSSNLQVSFHFLLVCSVERRFNEALLLTILSIQHSPGRLQWSEAILARRGRFSLLDIEVVISPSGRASVRTARFNKLTAISSAVTEEDGETSMRLLHRHRIDERAAYITTMCWSPWSLGDEGRYRAASFQCTADRS